MIYPINWLAGFVPSTVFTYQEIQVTQTIPPWPLQDTLRQGLCDFRGRFACDARAAQEVILDSIKESVELIEARLKQQIHWRKVYVQQRCILIIMILCVYQEKRGGKLLKS